jgi:hypothetical protein
MDYPFENLSPEAFQQRTPTILKDSRYNLPTHEDQT